MTRYGAVKIYNSSVRPIRTHSVETIVRNHRDEHLKEGLRSRHSSVGIATGYGLDDRGFGVRVPVGLRFFSTSSRSAVGSTHPTIKWVPGALSLGIKRRRREADHSPPASAEAKKMCIYISTATYAFMS
jgi:hypothetical protein